ncbi:MULTISPECIES: helix-turn-helix transcriptional regulator [unclassified Arthrobacter]|uniref:helix-turn-helix transcriptional regulator n=1 Tax=unclassified Arthrobacter TaxID=235627 RepID=UPI0004177311|nr:MULTISPECIES: helix-turn-helix transcriptional regulator [unclassified Arthrobacter]PVE19657.1 LuxR family transcriptional regulator [Arthrobacter sp. Bz4]
MLDGLGLELYRYAVAHPGWTRQGASEALGYTLRDIDSATNQLSERKLLSSHAADSDAFVAISPDVALADLVDADERLVQDLKSRINTRRLELSGLVPLYLEARRDVLSSASVEVLEDPHLIQRVLIEYGRDVSEHVLMAVPGQGANADFQEENVRKDVDLLKQGVNRRNLYDLSTRDHMPTRKAVKAIAAEGGEFRTLPSVPFRMLIFDRKLAVVARQLTSDDKAAMMIRDPNLVNVFIRFFNFTWEFAEPFPTEEDTVSPLNGTQQAILAGLAAGYSDEVIARRLDLSVRTCRRHIAWMLEALKADSRFQAGAKARDAGWI